MQLEYHADPEIHDAIAALGRTEDIMFSPSNTRLAVASFQRHAVMVIELDVDIARQPNPIVFTSCVTIACRSFVRPHGVAWLDDQTLVVGSRAAGVAIIEVPDAGEGARRTRVRAKRQLKADGRLIKSPGSVCCLPHGNAQAQILVCNNYADNVARHIVGLDDDFSPVSGEVLLAKGLSVPDSICVSPGGGWIAVANHHKRCAFIYRNSPALGPEQEPDGKLLGINYPHGLRFSADGRYCLVADAGAPCVHIYAEADGDWAGERFPDLSLRILDDATYFRGAINQEEGGPKGLDLTADRRVLVSTCEQDQIIFTDLTEGLEALCDAAARGERRPEFLTRAKVDELAFHWQTKANQPAPAPPRIPAIVQRLQRAARRAIAHFD